MPTRRPPKMTGRDSLFRQKLRDPVSLTLTPRHHAKVRAAMARLGVSRSDLVALLIESYADSVTIPPRLLRED